MLLIDTANNRLKRIKEVRAQEKLISQLQVSKYRSELSECKKRKLQENKEAKRIQLAHQQQDLLIQWQRALVENGKAHIVANTIKEQAVPKRYD
jgi:hypothetical protein